MGTKNRGITWLLEVRIIFGVGALFIIIAMCICCWCRKKYRRYSRSSSFYHHKATDPEMTSFEHHIHSVPLSKFDHEQNEDQNTKNIKKKNGVKKKKKKKKKKKS